MFVHVRDMVVQVVRPCFSKGLQGYLCPGCGRFLFGFLCPGCGLELFMVAMLGSQSLGFGVGGLYRAVGPSPMFLGEVLSVCCLLC